MPAQHRANPSEAVLLLWACRTPFNLVGQARRPGLTQVVSGDSRQQTQRARAAFGCCTAFVRGAHVPKQSSYPLLFLSDGLCVRCQISWRSNRQRISTNNELM